MRFRLIKLAAVGGAAFVVDAGMMAILIEGCALPPLPARILAFGVALTFSFLLNRSVTFADRPRQGLGQFGAYVAASTASGLANIATFAALLAALPPAGFAPYLAMPAGVLVGLGFNAVLYNRIVFPARLKGKC